MERARGSLPDLRHLERTPLEVLECGEFQLEAHVSTPDAVVDCSRLLMLVRGELAYTVETATVAMQAPAMIYVPFWTRRHWLLTGASGGQVIYAEFMLPADTRLRTPRLLAQVTDARRELEAMRHVVANTHSRHALAVLAAIELKAILARFLLNATPIGTGVQPRKESPEQHIETALDWIDEHFAEADVLNRLPTVTRLTADYLRRLFKKQTGLSPKQYLTVQRMRAARFKLRQSDLLIKEIADQVGYGDAFHFSRQYRKFWGRSPAEDRAG